MSRIRIGQLLVRSGLLQPAQLEEALAAQQIYGGRLGTVLVEHGFVHEDALADLLARQAGMPRVRREDLTDVDRAVIALVPPGIATRFRVVPFRYDEGRKRLHLATADPGDLTVQDQLQFVLERAVSLYLCPEILVARALEKYHGVTRERRFIKLSLDDAGSRKQPDRPPPTDGPGILRRMVDAPTKEALLECVVDSLSTLAAQVAFLCVRGDALSAWTVRGLPGWRRAQAPPEVRVADSKLLRQALAGRRSLHAEVADDAALRATLGNGLGMDVTSRVVVVPLLVADRTFGAFVLARLEPSRTADPALLDEIARRVGWRLQALHLMERVAAPLGQAD